MSDLELLKDRFTRVTEEENQKSWERWVEKHPGEYVPGKILADLKTKFGQYV